VNRAGCSCLTSSSHEWLPEKLVVHSTSPLRQHVGGQLRVLWSCRARTGYRTANFQAHINKLAHLISQMHFSGTLAGGSHHAATRARLNLQHRMLIMLVNDLPFLTSLIKAHTHIKQSNCIKPMKGDYISCFGMKAVKGGCCAGAQTVTVRA